jgi:hypothetical protein
MGDMLARATDVRASIAHWLFAERCPDWDLAFVVVSELHSAIEAFWHGVDPSHRLHAQPSSKAAGDGLHAVYRATDRLVGALVDAFPDASVVAFSMNGMGPNRSDCASMVLLSELLYRCAFGRALLRVPSSWSAAPNDLPMLGADQDWSAAVKTHISSLPEPLDLARRIAARVLPESVKRVLRGDGNGHAPAAAANGTLKLALDWMPTGLYQPYWPTMRFFALPSFYDGRVRINLKGRERNGMVAPADYEAACDEVEALVCACRDFHTGEPVVDHIERMGGRDPLTLGPSESDLVIVWRVGALGFRHPDVGEIGPPPHRRTGGHTGPYGMAFIANDGLRAADYGVRSSFDVVPTIVELLGESMAPGWSGKSLLAARRVPLTR